MSCAQFKLDMFEGPLDLLLHLISKHKLNIHDIEISLLLEQYMEYIHQLDHEDLEDAADFLEMAARLIYIKTVSLLPQDEEAQELKKELEGRLIEYSQCKYLASVLARSYAGGEIFVRKPEPVPVDKTYTREHDPSVLLEAYLGLSERARNEKPINAKLFQPIVSHKVVSVGSKIVYILKKLYTVGVCDLSHIYDGMQTKSERVATFLAILELTKSGRICLNDDNTQISFSDKTRERKKHSSPEPEQPEQTQTAPEPVDSSEQTSEATPVQPEQTEQAQTAPEPVEPSEQTSEATPVQPEQPEQAQTAPEPVEPSEQTSEATPVQPEQTEQAQTAPEPVEPSEQTSEVTAVQPEQPEQTQTAPEPVEPSEQTSEATPVLPEQRDITGHRPVQPKPIAERVSRFSYSIFVEPQAVPSTAQTQSDFSPQEPPLQTQPSQPCEVIADSGSDGTPFKPSYWGRVRYYWGFSPVGDDSPGNYWRYGGSKL